jgi:hypothetical protein
MDLEFIKDKSLSNIEKRNKLVDIKYIYKDLLNKVEKELDILNTKITNECKHEFIYERESGPYGERFKVCKKCHFYI